MTWAALWNSLVPYLVYDTLDQVAYYNFYDVVRPDEGVLTRDHWTKENYEWEIIAIAMGAVYGVQFLLGLISLSEFLYPVTAFYFEHVVSNIMIPLHLFVIYKAVEVAVIMDGLW